MMQGYDAIYRDLAPFMSMPPQEFNRRLELLRDSPHVTVYEIKGGKVTGPHATFFRLFDAVSL